MKSRTSVEFYLLEIVEIIIETKNIQSELTDLGLMNNL